MVGPVVLYTILTEINVPAARFAFIMKSTNDLAAFLAEGVKLQTFEIRGQFYCYEFTN